MKDALRMAWWNLKEFAAAVFLVAVLGVIFGAGVGAAMLAYRVMVSFAP